MSEWRAVSGAIITLMELVGCHVGPDTDTGTDTGTDTDTDTDTDRH